MWALELVEGKDAPPESGAQEFDEQGKTAGLLLQLTKGIHVRGLAIVLDSGFCVLGAIIALQKFGAYALALIKKQHTGQSMYQAI